ncbi:MAG: hypothetical protein ACK40G_13795 [Cytophagaceae bacterium]
MKLEMAKMVAEMVKSKLAPYCEKIEIAGSIRRQKPEVGDIEIVCIPKTVKEVKKDLFGGISEVEEKRDPGFLATVNEWEAIKGKAEGKYTQRLLKGRTGATIKLDLFTANHRNWGYILAIRTGSANFSKEVLAKGWVSKGYKGLDGYLMGTDGRPVSVPDEETLFRLIGKSYVLPKDRI